MTAAAGRPPGGASAALLIIVGEEDVAEVGDIADVPAERVPGAIKRIVAGADQLVHVAKPERFNQLARDFSTSEG